MKKIFAGICTAALLLIAPSLVSAKQFPDVNHQTEMGRAIDYLSDKGVIIGFLDGKFRPYDRVTRGQASKIVAGMTYTTSERSFPGNSAMNLTPTFKDITAKHQYYIPIEGLAAYNVIQGYSDGYFYSGRHLTRAHIAQMLAYAYVMPTNQHSAFKDVPKNSARYPYISAIYQAKIMNQTSPQMFSPNIYVSRGEFALFVYRAHIQAENALKQAKATNKPFIASSSKLGIALKSHAVMKQTVYQNMTVAAARLAVAQPHVFSLNNLHDRASLYYQQNFSLGYGREPQSTVSELSITSPNMTIQQVENAIGKKFVIEKLGAENYVYYFGLTNIGGLYYKVFTNGAVHGTELPAAQTAVFNLEVSTVPFEDNR